MSEEKHYHYKVNYTRADGTKGFLHTWTTSAEKAEKMVRQTLGESCAVEWGPVEVEQP